MSKKTLILFLLFTYNYLHAQIIINEGSNKNYNAIADENGDYPDWIEIYNTTPDTLSLLNYALSDNETEPTKWTFPNVKLPPNEFKTIFCSGKDRKPISGFTTVVNTGTYNPTTGWNNHPFDTPFYWDGVSNILVLGKVSRHFYLRLFRFKMVARQHALLIMAHLLPYDPT